MPGITTYSANTRQLPLILVHHGIYSSLKHCELQWLFADSQFVDMGIEGAQKFVYKEIIVGAVNAREKWLPVLLTESITPL